MRCSAVILAFGIAAACDSGSVDIVLTRPASPAAQLDVVATVVLRAERFDADDIVLTASISDHTVAFGDLPIGSYHAMSVELFGVTGAAVGYGRASEGVDITFDGHPTVYVPIRRPRVYLAGPAPDRTIEAPLVLPVSQLVRVDRGSPAVDIESIALPAATARIAAAGADLFIANGAQVFRFDSSRDVFDSDPLVDVGATIRDLAGSANGKHLIAGSSTGLHIIDVVARTTQTVPTGQPVDAVGAASELDGGVIAIALIGAVRSPSQCAGAASRLIVAGLTESEPRAREIDLSGGVHDIAATPNRPLVVASDYCRDRVTIVDLATDRISGTVEGIESPTAVVATNGTAWAVGAIAGETSMPESAEENVDKGARHQLAAIDLSQTDLTGRITEFPEIAQLIIPSDEPTSSLAQNARAKLAAASSLSLSARGDQLLLSSNAVHRVQQVTIDDGFVERGVFPPMAVHTSQQYTISTSTGAIESVIVTRCRVCAANDHATALDFGEGCNASGQNWGYPLWRCAPSAGVLDVANFNFEVGASAALYGRP